MRPVVMEKRSGGSGIGGHSDSLRTARLMSVVVKVCHSRFLLPKMTNLASISLLPKLDLLDSAWQSNRLDHFYRWDCSNTGSLVTLAI